MFDAYNYQKTEKLNELRYLAWHIASFMWAKKLPPLKEVLIDYDKPQTEKKSAKYLEDMCRIINAQIGGKEAKRE